MENQLTNKNLTNIEKNIDQINYNLDILTSSDNDLILHYEARLEEYVSILENSIQETKIIQCKLKLLIY